MCRRVAAGSSDVVTLTLLVAVVRLTTSGTLVEAAVMPCVDPTAPSDEGQLTYYDPSRQLCCSGTVHQLEELGGQSCCGTQVVDRVTHLCCGTQAVPVQGNPELQCCGGSVVYDTETHMCCGNNVYALTQGYNTCCGNYPMDELHDTCCQVTGPFGVRTMPSKGKGQCCGLELTYDPAEQMCCQRETENGMVSKVLSRAGGEVACCSGQAYNTSEKACCGDQLRDMLHGNTQCCGQELYNPDNMCCCADKLFPIGHGKCCGDHPYHPGSASCCQGVLQPGLPEVPGGQGCCGSVSFLATESLCCGGQLQDWAPGRGCCGKVAYDNETELCCGGNVWQRTSPDDKCCGPTSYNPSEETCCRAGYPMGGEQLFPLVNGSCCGELAFLPSEATCCVGKTRDILYQDVPASTSTCCGHYLLHPDTHLCDPETERPVRKSKPDHDRICSSRSWSRSKSYNSTTEVCIRGKVWSKKGISPKRRCGQSSMDPEREICCMGWVQPARDRQGNARRCCHHSVRSFAPQHQTCCSGRVDNISSHTSKCCRNRAYNTATHVCNRSGMIRPMATLERYPLTCAGQPYHPAANGCCGHRLTGPGQTCCRGTVFETGTAGLGDGACCGGVTGYNPGRDLCCGETVHRDVREGAVCCGSSVYSPGDGTQTCCQGTLHSSWGGARRNCSGGTAYDATRETVCGGVVHPSPNGACCERAVYDSTAQICCNGNLYPKTKPEISCCGTVPYDLSNPLTKCCSGSLHRVPHALSTCCGNQLFDQRYQHCCLDGASGQQSAAYVLSAAGGRTCNSLQSGNGTVYVQCEGVVRAAGARGSCCDEGFGRGSSSSSSSSNGSTYMCCSGHLLPRLYGKDSQCCGRDVINAAVDSC